MKYSISYDLRKPGRDYKTLYEALALLNAKRMLESQWVANRSNTNASGLRDYLQQYIDPNDGLFLCTLDGASDWASYNTVNTPKDV